MNNINRLPSILICFLVLVFLGCRKDDFNETTTTIDPPIVEEVESGISGLVSDENGDALEGATVTVRGTATTTDANGYFNFSNLVLDGQGSLVTVVSTGYFMAYKQVFPTKQGKSFAGFALVERGEAQTFESGNGSTVSIDGMAEVQFPANGIMYEDEQAFNGTVKVYSTYFDPTADNTFMTMPGNLGGQNKNGKQVQLGTYGMIGVELEDNTGRKLQMKPGVMATILLDLPTQLENAAPETITLWHFDEVLGLWIEEGTANKESGKYVGQVNHFSFWNCDISWPSVKLSMKLVTTNGEPISNFHVYVSAEGVGSASGYTNIDGDICGRVPIGVDLTIIANSCGEKVIEQSIGTLTEDTNLGNVEIDYLKRTTTISGRLLDCLGQPSSESYGILDYSDYLNELITADENGNFSKTITICNNVESLVTFYNAKDLTVSKTTTIDVNASTNTLGDIEVCDDLEEYIRFIVDGASVEALVTDLTVDLTDGNTLTIRTNDGTNGYANFDIESVVEGMNTPANSFFFHPDDGEEYGGLICNDEYSCDDFSVEILTLGTEVEEYITGKFSGTLQPDSLRYINPEPTLLDVAIEGQFKVKIDYAYEGASVSGLVWFDSDEDGIRTNADPFVQSNGRIYATNGLTGHEAVNKTVFLSDDGTYAIDGLRPGDYTLFILPSNGGFGINTTGVNVDNDDTIDNDFFNSPEGTKTLISLQEGKQLTNVDAGLIGTDNLNLSVSHSGCQSETQLRINILGNGAPPYTVKLNGVEQVTTSDNVILLDVLGGQNYDIEVMDAIMGMGMASLYLPENNVGIEVNVFEDNTPNNNGIFDQSEETLLDDINIKIYSSAGVLVKSFPSTANYGRDLDELPAGDYYIEADLPTGFTYTIIPAPSAFANIIDAATGRSELITVECDGYYQLTIGIIPE